MRNVYFYCDSQANILTAYFMRKIYYDMDSEYNNILLVSNNSSKSVACAKRADKSGVWQEVYIVEELFKDKKGLETIGCRFEVRSSDIVCLFALQNRFARFMYKKASLSHAKICILDEGVTLFNDFLTWQETNFDGMFADIDVSKSLVDAWCYEPKLYDMPDNVKLSRIELQEQLRDKSVRELMQNEVRQIFDIKTEAGYEIIYFDQYYSLQGRTIGLVEKYHLKKLEIICQNYNFVIKPHPMERGFPTKYDDINVPIMESKDSPWEAVYFVNYYKNNRKIICMAGESLALAAPLLMFGDKNYNIILLKNIYDKNLNFKVWGAKDFFRKFQEQVVMDADYFAMPDSFAELQKTIMSLLPNGEEHNSLLMMEDEKFIHELCADIINYRPSFLICTLQITTQDRMLADLKKEYILDRENFRIQYDLPMIDEAAGYLCKWIPCGRCYLALKNVKVMALLDTGKNINIDEIIYDQTSTVLDSGFVENDSFYPSFSFFISGKGIQKITISGEWIFDFRKDRIINEMERQKGELEKKICTINDDYSVKNEQLKSEKEKLWEERNLYMDENERLKSEKDMYKIANEQLQVEKDTYKLESEQLQVEKDTYKQESEQLCKERILLKEENRHLQDRINAIYSSKSWKMTKLYREIGELLKRKL